MEVLKTIAMGS